MNKPIIFILTICFSIMAYSIFSIIGNENHMKTLVNQLEQVDAETSEARKDFYKIIDEANLQAFVEAKTQKKIIEQQIKYYLDINEPMDVNDEIREQARKEAQAEVVTTFINNVLSKNGIDQSAFRQEFRNLLKLSALESLDDQLEGLASKLIRIVKSKYNIDLYVYEGKREATRQEQLFQQGRNTKGSIVTNAPAWSSPHQYGYAFDVACMKDGILSWGCDWSAIGREGKNLGLVWGGDWGSLVDKPHFELQKKYWSQNAIVKQYVCARKSPVCENSDDFIEVGKEKGVDPYLLVAIAVADTSLGKSLKTEYNIGNWGNVDHDIYGKSCIGKTTDGCGVHLSSWREGIEKMATATSIRKNDKIGHLSPFCNMGGIHYAMSEYNWHKNVTAVMSELHGNEIGCNYIYKK